MDRLAVHFYLYFKGVTLKLNRSLTVAALVWGVCLYLAYSLGLPGTFYYDDIRPLSGLTAAHDLSSAMIYALGDISGPLGRPLSMFSFLLNQSDWPNNVSDFLRINIAVHVVNTALVLLLTRTLLILKGVAPARASSTALLVTVLWSVLPIQVTTSLITVQRMAGLSAVFVFLGVFGYLRALRSLDKRKFVSTLYPLAVLGCATILSMFAKENGALLPVFVFVLELTLLAGVPEVAPWRRLRLSLTGGTTLLLVAYLVIRSLSSTDYSGRDFTLEERLLTESVVLFDYLRAAFLPDPFAISPFHDQYPVQRMLGWGNGLAILALIGGLLLAVTLRRRAPVFAFAVLWFLAAHLLESTVVGLELYFEHRNYVALFGPCLAIVWGVSGLADRYRKIALGVVAAYCVGMLAILCQVTSLWSKPLDAALVWFDTARGSSRAAEHLALMFLGKGKVYEAGRVMEMQTERCPDCVGSAVQAMLLSCIEGRDADVRRHYEQALSLAARPDLGSAPSALTSMFKQIESGQCKALGLDDLQHLLAAMASAQEKGGANGYLLHLYSNLQRLAVERGDDQTAMLYLQKVWAIKNDPGVAEVLLGYWVRQQKFDEARQFVGTEMCRNLPRNPWLADARRERCAAAMKYVERESAKRKEG
ncbi:hypothetical protein IB274_09125 [Pseudomonas sp. PDM18]|uniref:tetratricopeptide repeat protein n=1 Tax=Pseudomonas sp. PDM18 TaxID=2769253 RepID=UPI00177F2CCC|nr:hypothetical protein [Pseudomonas sp. PDM18]MBD9676856.1 hypothetical protein [Pseudomonas sp. PDM18]